MSTDAPRPDEDDAPQPAGVIFAYNPKLRPTTPPAADIDVLAAGDEGVCVRLLDDDGRTQAHIYLYDDAIQRVYDALGRLLRRPSAD